MDQTIDAEEIARFEKVAAHWWDLNGPYKPLHALNPTRVTFLRDHICALYGRDVQSPRPLKGLRILDIGCGGGLVCEPLSRLGAEVTGVDATAENTNVAAAHAAAVGLDIHYHAGAAADLIGEEKPFDVVLALEVVEHVADLDQFLADCRALLKDGGGFGYSTLNRTLASLLVAKIGAEYVARLLPKGTHDWRKFLKPEELATALQTAGLTPQDVKGINYNPLTREWSLGAQTAINYIGWAEAI